MELIGFLLTPLFLIAIVNKLLILKTTLNAAKKPILIIRLFTYQHNQTSLKTKHRHSYLIYYPHNPSPQASFVLPARVFLFLPVLVSLSIWGQFVPRYTSVYGEIASSFTPRKDS